MAVEGGRRDILGQDSSFPVENAPSASGEIHPAIMLLLGFLGVTGVLNRLHLNEPADQKSPANGPSEKNEAQPGKSLLFSRFRPLVLALPVGHRLLPSPTSRCAGIIFNSDSARRTMTPGFFALTTSAISRVRSSL